MNVAEMLIPESDNHDHAHATPLPLAPIRWTVVTWALGNNEQTDLTPSPNLKNFLWSNEITEKDRTDPSIYRSDLTTELNKGETDETTINQTTTILFLKKKIFLWENWSVYMHMLFKILPSQVPMPG